MSDNFTIKGGILCDAQRREDNGKLFLIGVYAANILVQTFPTNLMVSCVAIVESLKAGEFDIEFETLLDNKVQGSGKGKLGTSEPGTSLLTIQNIVLNNLTPGTLKFRLREPNKSWQTILEMPIVQS
jgi:hypothetical protein